MDATVTFYCGEERLSNAEIVADGETVTTDVNGAIVIPMAPGRHVFRTEHNGESLSRGFDRHGSGPRFDVDFCADDDEDLFANLTGLVGDRFLIRRVVARAPTGTVVKAWDRQRDREVALRAPSDELATREEAHQVFLLEARNLMELEHPHLLNIFEVLSIHGRTLLVTEWVEGETLDALLREDRIEPARAWETVLPLASAVAQLHRADIVHRDLHAANILVRADGSPKLIDLGLARSLADIYLGAARVHETREHCAPEQVQGLHVSPATDVYQLTMLFYRIYAGRWPFDASDQAAASVRSTPRPLEGAPEPLAHLVARCLSRQPRERLPDAASWFREFSSLEEALHARPAPNPDSTKRWGLIAAVVLIVATVVGLAAIVSMDDDTSEAAPVELGTGFGESKGGGAPEHASPKKPVERPAGVEVAGTVPPESKSVEVVEEAPEKVVDESIEAVNARPAAEKYRPQPGKRQRERRRDSVDPAESPDREEEKVTNDAADAEAVDPPTKVDENVEPAAPDLLDVEDDDSGSIFLPVE